MSSPEPVRPLSSSSGPDLPVPASEGVAFSQVPGDLDVPGSDRPWGSCSGRLSGSADLDGDGLLDLVCLLDPDAAGRQEASFLLRMAGARPLFAADPRFPAVPVSCEAGSSVAGTLVLDANADGLFDMAVTCEKTLPGNVFSGGYTAPPATTQLFAASEDKPGFHRAGKPVASLGMPLPADPLGTGHPMLLGFQPAESGAGATLRSWVLPTGEPHRALATLAGCEPAPLTAFPYVDFDGDCLPDLLILCADRRTMVALSPIDPHNTQSAWQSRVVLALTGDVPVPGHPGAVAGLWQPYPVDVDGDGLLDIVAALLIEGRPLADASPLLGVFLNSRSRDPGAGLRDRTVCSDRDRAFDRLTFSSAPDLFVRAPYGANFLLRDPDDDPHRPPRAIRLGDIDRDGRTDLLVPLAWRDDLLQMAGPRATSYAVLLNRPRPDAAVAEEDPDAGPPAVPASSSGALLARVFRHVNDPVLRRLSAGASDAWLTDLDGTGAVDVVLHHRAATSGLVPAPADGALLVLRNADTALFRHRHFLKVLVPSPAFGAAARVSVPSLPSAGRPMKGAPAPGAGDISHTLVTIQPQSTYASWSSSPPLADPAWAFCHYTSRGPDCLGHGPAASRPTWRQSPGAVAVGLFGRTPAFGVVAQVSVTVPSAGRRAEPASLPVVLEGVLPNTLVRLREQRALAGGTPAAPGAALLTQHLPPAPPPSLVVTVCVGAASVLLLLVLSYGALWWGARRSVHRARRLEKVHLMNFEAL